MPFSLTSGIITFKKSIELQETFKLIPLNKLLIETDSPFLAPEPNRGKNEPSFFINSNMTTNWHKLNEISSEKLIQETTSNFNILFN